MKISILILSIFLSLTLSGQKIYLGNSNNGDENFIYVMENSYCEISDTLVFVDFAFFAVKKDDQHIYIGNQVALGLNANGGPYELTISHHDGNGVFVEDIIKIVLEQQFSNMTFIDDHTIMVVEVFNYVLVDLNTRTYTRNKVLNESFWIRDVVVIDSTVFISRGLTTNELSILDLDMQTTSLIPGWAPLGLDFWNSHSGSFDIIGTCREDLLFLNSHTPTRDREAFLTYQRPPNFVVENECFLDFLRGFLSIVIDVVQYPLILDFDVSEEYCEHNDTTVAVQLCAGDDLIDYAIGWNDILPYIEEHQDHIDSMTVEIIGGPSWARLEDNNSPQLITQRFSDQKITFSNDGDSSIEDFREAILSAEILGLDSLYNGTIEVQFQLFSYIRRSLPASLFIDIYSEILVAGRDTSVTFCPLDVPQDLNDFLSTEAQAGQWLHGPMFDPQQDVPGNYDYVVSGNFCPEDTAHITVQLYPEAIVENQIYSVCPGDSILYAGRYYTEAAMFLDTIYTVETGCDSIIYDINIEVSEVIDITIDTILCSGVTIQVGNQIFSEATQEELLLVDSQGCDSIQYVIDIEYKQLQEASIDTLLCAGEVFNFMGQTYTESVTDQIVIMDSEGCDSLIINLSIDFEQSIFLPDQIFEIPLSNPTQVIVAYDLDHDSLTWFPEEGLSCADCLDPIVDLEQDATYQIEINPIGSCAEFINVQFFVIEEEEIESDFYLPNIISRSDSGNDKFFLQSNSDNLMTYSMSIYDRWGNQVYAVENINSNDESEGWGGSNYNGVELVQGVYVYKIVLEDGTVVSGDILVLR